MAELDQEPERVIDVFRLNKKHRLPWVLSIGGTWLASGQDEDGADDHAGSPRLDASWFVRAEQGHRVPDDLPAQGRG